MISSKHRFHGYNSLRHVYGHGQTVRQSVASLKYLENKRRKDYRLAVVVAKKVHKSAVKRNRIRRRLYEALRRREPEILRPYDMVLSVFSEQVAEMPAEDVDKMVDNLLNKAGIVGSRADQ